MKEQTMNPIETGTTGQSRSKWKTAAVIIGGCALSFLLSCAIYIMSKITGRPLWHFTSDHADVFTSPVYVGFLNTLGVMLWSAAAATTLLGFILLRRIHMNVHLPMFLLWSACICAMFAFDDAFGLHERVIPQYLHIPEKMVFGCYAAIIVLYAVRFFDVIVGSEPLLFLTALLFLGLSAFMDQFLPYTNIETFAEDSAKFAGILLWSTYYLRTTGGLCRGVLTQSGVIGRSERIDQPSDHQGDRSSSAAQHAPGLQESMP
jgi:hypothetical protein